MRKLGALVIGGALLISLATPVYAASPKAGAICTKKNVTVSSAGKLYTCILSGKKLIWNKGVAINPSQSSSTSQTTTGFMPWSTKFIARQVSDEAQKQFRDWASKQIEKSSLHKLIVDISVPPLRSKNFKAVDQLDLKLFGQFFTQPSATVIGTNEKWIVDQLNSNYGKYENCDSSAGNDGLYYCLDQGSTMGFMVKSDQNFNPKSPGQDGSSLLSHEYFHIVQRALFNSTTGIPIKSGGDNSATSFPVWFVEGTANFVGFSVAALALNSTYWEGREMMFNYAPPSPTTNKNTLEDYEIRNGPGNDSPTYPYIAGQLATEYLVASVGFQKMLDIWIDFKDTKNFEKSFQRVIGITKADFYSKFEAARTNLGLPEVSWKLVCLTNTPLKDVPSKSQPCNYNVNGSNPNPGNTPPPIDKTSNIDGLGCSPGAEDIVNTYGRFVCTSLAGGNNLWKKQG